MSWIREQFSHNDLQRLLFMLSERVKAFHGLSPAEVGEIMARAERHTFENGATIIAEGVIGTHMHIILEGEASVTRAGRNVEGEAARLRPPDSFGELALVERDEQGRTLTAESFCLLARLDHAAIEARPEIGLKVYRNIAFVLAERLSMPDEAQAWRL